MADKPRVLQSIFGDNAPTGEIGQIGSDAAGIPTTTKDLSVIQALSQYLGGLYDITAQAGEPPRIEDLNGLYFLLTSQVAYLLEKGVPEWLDDADQRYYADKSVVSRNGATYIALLGDDTTNINAQQDPETSPTWWHLLTTAPAVGGWNAVESSAYDTAGVVVAASDGLHYTSSGSSGNTNLDPVNPDNTDYWFPSPGIEALSKMAKSGKVVDLGTHKTLDRADSDYQTSLLLDSAEIAGTTYDFYRVALDGSTVTGDTTLEAIFKPGLSGEYHYIDRFAPDNLGTRTLLDAGGDGVRFQESSGDFATMGGKVADQFQGHWHNTRFGASSGGSNRVYQSTTTGQALSGDTTEDHAQAPTSDGTNGTPRTGTRTYGPTFVSGVGSIVVMVAR